MIRLAFVVAATLLCVACSRQDDASAPPTQAETRVEAKPAPVQPTSEGAFQTAITAEDFAARLQKLSSDQFEGRQPGTIGERMSTAYIKDQFERIGLKPGNKGSWFQTVPMMKVTVLDPTQVALAVNGSKSQLTLGIGADSVIGSLKGSPQVTLKDSPIVFVGYGVNAPDWNDYADLDVAGKTVIALINDPGWGNQDPNLFKGPALTYYGRWTYKFEEAARRGAAALFIVHETGGAGYPWSVVENGWTGPQFSLPSSEDPAPRLDAAGWLSEDAATRLFASAGADFASLKKSADIPGFKPVALDAKLSVSFRSGIESASSENVVGMLPGSERPDEAVFYTAHWDHLGKDDSLTGDQIYNGAIDNATGVAAMMEIAEALKQQPNRRSVVFAAVTLEESGLLGSRYLVGHLPFAADKVVADINIDILALSGPSRSVTSIGYGQSDMDDYLMAAAKEQSRTVVPDDKPEKGFFFRSDHINFARVGIPALYASSGMDLVDGGEAAGRKAADDYTSNRYHKPSDNYDPNWDFRGAVQDMDLLLAIGRRLANESTFPQWKAGADFSRPEPAQSRTSAP